MPRKVSRRLVIDASVARAAGGEDATHPISKHSRDFLRAVLNVSHYVVMTPDIRNEWRRNQSTFARRWLVSMTARRKVLPIDIHENRELYTRLTHAASTPREREAMQKDTRLLDAAMATDNTIVSLDETVRRLFAVASVQVGELRIIVWVNPGNVEDEQPIAWLRNGAKAERARRLGTYLDTPKR